MPQSNGSNEYRKQRFFQLSDMPEMHQNISINRTFTVLNALFTCFLIYITAL